jgi:hypothetical protein
LEPMLADALGSLAFQTSFEMPSLDPNGSTVPIDLVTDFFSTDLSPAGAELKLRAGMFGPQMAPHVNDGALMRGGCGTGIQTMTLPKESPLEIAFSDDTFNMLLYAAWKGGLLEFDVPASMLSAVDLSAFGIEEMSVHVSGMLAPVISDCNPNNNLQLHLGDLKIDATITLFGSTMDVLIYASFQVDVELSVDNGEIGLALSEVTSLETEVTVLQEALITSEYLVADLVNETLVPSLLDSLGGGALGAFPLPEIALDSGLPGTPGGTSIAIEPISYWRLEGNSLISGVLK